MKAQRDAVKNKKLEMQLARDKAEELKREAERREQEAAEAAAKAASASGAEKVAAEQKQRELEAAKRQAEEERKKAEEAVEANEASIAEDTKALEDNEKKLQEDLRADQEARASRAGGTKDRLQRLRADLRQADVHKQQYERSVSVLKAKINRMTPEEQKANEQQLKDEQLLLEAAAHDYDMLSLTIGDLETKLQMQDIGEQLNDAEIQAENQYALVDKIDQEVEERRDRGEGGSHQVLLGEGREGRSSAAGKGRVERGCRGRG